MNTGKLIVLVLATLLIVMGTAQIAYVKYKYPSTKVIPMHVEVSRGTILGVNTQTDALYFGKIPSGDQGIRFLNVTNNYGTPVEVGISTEGDLASWVGLSKNYFVLDPGQTEQITAFVIVPGDAEAGNYDGMMQVVLKRV